MSSLAVCDVDGDGLRTSSSARPATTAWRVGATGAVYIVWGGWDKGTTVDLAQLNAQGDGLLRHLDRRPAGRRGRVRRPRRRRRERHHRGRAGRRSRARPIYAVFGQLNFRANRPIDLSSATTGAEIVWTTATAAAGLGKVLFAATQGPGRSRRSSSRRRRARWSRTCSPTSGRRRRGAVRLIDANAADHPSVHRHRGGGAGSGRSRRAPIRASGSRSRSPIRRYRLASDTAMRRGKVYLFANVALTGTAPIDAASASPTITGKDKNSQLGTSLLIADTSGNGDDLFVGAPGDGSTGAVYVFKHATGLLLPCDAFDDRHGQRRPDRGLTSRAGSSAARWRARAPAAPTGSAAPGRRRAQRQPRQQSRGDRCRLPLQGRHPAQVPGLRAGLREGRR